MEANVAVIEEGFWARCWRQASEAVYGIKSHIKKAAHHVKAKAKASWSWMTSATNLLAHRAKAGWSSLKLKAAKMWHDFNIVTKDAKKVVSAAFTSAKVFLALESLRIFALASKVYNWVKDGLTQAAEEAVTLVMKIAMYAAMWLKVVVARIRTAIEVVWNYKKLAAVGAIAYLLAGLGVPFAGTIASMVIIGLLIMIDATVLAHSLQAEYTHYYYPQVSAAA
jgi:hypothetical protein